MAFEGLKVTFVLDRFDEIVWFEPARAFKRAPIWKLTHCRGQLMILWKRKHGNWIAPLTQYTKGLLRFGIQSKLKTDVDIIL